jgi:copper(I)-binding protein
VNVKGSTVLVAALVMMATMVAACGDDTGVSIDDPWSRASASTQNAGAVYMTISSGDGDTLVGVSVDPSIAAMAELHESSMAEEGTLSMQRLPMISVPAGGEVRLEPGGYHVMLMQLAEPLVDGSEFEVTLTFESAGDVAVTAKVEENR